MKGFIFSVLLTLVCSGLLVYTVRRFALLFGAELYLYITILSASGGFGGLIWSLLQDKRRFELCSISLTERKVGLGTIGDIVVGIGSALGVFLVLAGWMRFAIEPVPILQLVGLGIVAGYGGEHILATLTKRLQKRLEEVEKELAARDERLSELSLIAQGNAYIETDQARAEELYMRALEKNPNSARARVGMGVVRKRQQRLHEAIMWCSRAIEKDPKYAVAYYNRSCYKCLCKLELSEVLADLEEAIQLDEIYRELARLDQDFASIREQAEFLQLVKGEK